MRVNIYSEEITKQVVSIEKDANGKALFGTRVFLYSPPELHNTELDDDRSAVTFWFSSKDRRDKLSAALLGVLGFWDHEDNPLKQG